MNISLSWRSWSFMGILWQFIFNLFRHPAWWYFSLIVGPQHWPSRETRKYSAKCNIFNPTSLLVSSITMVGLPRLPVMFVMKSVFWWPIATQQLWSTPRKHQQRGEDDKPIPPKGDGSRAALAIGASVPFADKDNGEKFKIIYSLSSSSFQQTLNNQQNLHQFHFH